MSNKRLTVVKLKALKARLVAARHELSALHQKMREVCHHPKSTRIRSTEVVQSGILGMYETEITHEVCGICAHYIGDIP